MKFDRAELDKLERHEQHLTILASVIVLVLAGGVALLMYPLVFLHPDSGNKWTLRFAFTGFCVLSLLCVGYLLDRQRTVRKLKQQLLEELDRNLELRNQANVDLLHTIPGRDHFQDRLAMEFRRASSLTRCLARRQRRDSLALLVQSKNLARHDCARDISPIGDRNIDRLHIADRVRRLHRDAKLPGFRRRNNFRCIVERCPRQHTSTSLHRIASLRRRGHKVSS